MMRRPSAPFTRAIRSTLAALTLAALPATALAQTADLALCDRVAADPADPDRPAEVRGVAEIAAADIPTALKYCKLASAKSRRAMYELGRAFAANKQMDEAVAAWRKAAEKGSTSAMVELGVLLATSTGAARDDAQAHQMFERAAEAGNPRGVTNLIALASRGGPPVDPVRARAWLVRATESNSAEAQYQLGLMLAEGAGGPQDDVAARALFEKAAAQDNAGALERLGAFAQAGRGGAQDSAAAKRYYERAAALGNEAAKVALKRAECPYVLKDKAGKVVTNLCF